MPPKLDEVCAAHPIVLQCIQRYISGTADSTNPDVQNLRCVNRNLRTAVDRSQQRLVFKLKRQPVLSDGLASRFEVVDSLCIKVPRLPTYKDQIEEEGHGVLVKFLEQLQRQPVLLGKLRQLHLTLDLGHSCSVTMQEDIGIRAVLDTLSRCTGLQELQVKRIPFGSGRRFASTHTFKPQGATPQQRAAALQRQIAAFATSPDFLAPSTWPQHACLTAVDVRLNGAEWHWPCLQPYHFLAATSLVQLSVLLFGEGSVSDLKAFTAVRRLSVLTRLEIESDWPGCHAGTPKETILDVQQAIAEIPCLRSLLVGDIIFACASDSDSESESESESESMSPGCSSISIPEAWFQMKELQELHFVGCDIDAAELARCSSSITHLCLRESTLLGRLSSLTQLTALRGLELRGGTPREEHVVNGQLHEEEASEWLQVPPSWTREMRSLELTCNAEVLALLPHVQGLMHLLLDDAVITPALCRTLCQLSQLEVLHLMQSLTTSEGCNLQQPQELFPSLPASVRVISITAKDPNPLSSPLQAFVRCIQIPASRSTLPILYRPDWCYNSWQDENEDWLCLEAISLAWLQAMLHSWDMRSTSFVLPDDSAVHVMLAALGTVCGSQASGGDHCSGMCGMHIAASPLPASKRGKPGPPYTPDLVLGPEVTPAAFRQLFLYPHLPSGMLAIRGDPCKTAPTDELVPTGQGGALSHGHVSALVGACTTTLQHLELWDCSTLTDEDFALLARAAPALQCLLLGKAVNLTDAGLATLAACTKLSRLHLSKASCVTAAGAMLACVALPSLATLIVKGVEPAFAAAVQQACSEQQLSPVSQQWAVRVASQSTVELRVHDGSASSPTAGRQVDASGSAAVAEPNPAAQLLRELGARLKLIMERE